MLAETFLNRTRAAGDGIERLGVFGLYTFALFAWLGSSIAYLGLVLMLTALVLDWRRAWPVARRDWYSLLFLVFAGYTYLGTLLMGAAPTPEVAPQWEDANTWVTLWLFPLVAWWTQGNVKRITHVLGLAWIGLALDVVRRVDWVDWRALLYGERFSFGMTALDMALLSGVALLGLILLAARLWGDPQRRVAFGLRIALWSIVLVTCLFALIIVQSRAIWIAVAVVLPVMMLLRYRMRGVSGHAHSRRVVLAAAGFVVVLIVGVLVNYSDTIKARFTGESATIQAMMAGELENAPYTSIAARTHMNRFGLAQWAQRPWFGWGPAYDAISDSPKYLQLSGNLLPPVGVMGAPDERGYWSLRGVPLDRYDLALPDRARFRFAPTHERPQQSADALFDVVVRDVFVIEGKALVSEDFDGGLLLQVLTTDYVGTGIISSFGNHGIPIKDRGRWYPFSGKIYRQENDVSGTYRFSIGAVGSQGSVDFEALTLRRVLDDPAMAQIEVYPHLHNSYLEVLVRFGVVGAMFFGLAALWVFRAMQQGYRSGALPRDLYLFLIGTFLVTGLWALIEFRMMHMDFRLFAILFGGLAYSFRLSELRGN